MNLVKMILAVFILSLSSGVFSQDDPIPTGLGWNPSRTQLAVGYSDGHVEIINLVNQQVILTLSGHVYNTYFLIWSPDDTMLATGGYDSIINVWDTASGSLLASFPELSYDTVDSLGWSPDGRYLLIGHASGSNNFNVWDVLSQSFIYSTTIKTPSGIDYHPSHTKFALPILTGEIEIRDSTTFEIISTLQQDVVTDGPALLSGAIADVKWGSDGRFLATGTHDAEVVLWDMVTEQQLFRLNGSHLEENDLARKRILELWFNNDGSTISSISVDGSLRTWSTTTGMLLVDSELDGAPFTWVSVSPDLTQLAYLNTSNNIEITQIVGADQNEPQ